MMQQGQYIVLAIVVITGQVCLLACIRGQREANFIQDGLMTRELTLVQY